MIRRPLCLFCLLFWLSPAAFAAGDSPLSAEILESLRSRKVADRNLAIEKLGENPSEEAAALLEALLKGALHADKEDDTIFLLGEDETEGVDIVSGARRPFPDKSQLRKISATNNQRERIMALLNSRSLRHPDPETRRTAVAALLNNPVLDRDQILSLLSQETDGRARRYLEQALALLCLQNPQSPPEEMARAATILSDSASPRIRQALEAARQETRDPSVATAITKALYQIRVTAERGSLLETLFFGLSLGSVLVLTSIGLAVTFGVMGVINMAHGELVMLGAYTVWGMQQALPGQPGLALLLSIPAAFLVSGTAGAVMERGVIRYLYGRPLETLLATFGISLILQQAVRTLISPMNRAVESPAFMSGMWRITEQISLTANRIYILFFCLSVFALIYAAMHKTRLGLEVRAVTQNRPIACAMGIDAARVDTLTFALGSGVAGMAGVALSQLTNVGPNLGQSYIVDSFMVVVFGGVGNLWGTLSGGLILGMANKFLEPVSGAMLAKIILLAGLILFMQAQPKGLFPQRGRAAEG
jgi:urea transport system permease protein